MAGVGQHGAEKIRKRVREMVTKSRGQAEDLIGFGKVAGATHAQRFIEIYTEHTVTRLQLPRDDEVEVQFIGREGIVPIFIDATMTQAGWARLHGRPPHFNGGSITDF